MLNSDEERWVKTTANELNNLLQVIRESSEQLAELTKANAGAEKYLTMLRDSVSRAADVTRQLAQKVGGMPTGPDALAANPKTVSIDPIAKPRVTLPSPPVPITIHNPAGHRELILLVDDEEFVLLLASRVLTGDGYRIVTAKDGFQAIDFYKRLQSEIALVILDFSMPVMDGAEVFSELQSLNQNVAVVLTSGFAEQERLRLMLARGLRAFIPKPYTNQRLLDQVRQAIASTKR
jgi:CheY-like chemotaxis protein